METYFRDHAAITAKATIELMKVAHTCMNGSEEEQMMPGDVLLILALIVGEMEGRMMTAAKAATYIGMARATAVRRLEMLRERGMVAVHENRRWQATAITPDMLCSAHSTMHDAGRIIQKASAELSKMDGHTVANPGKS